MGGIKFPTELTMNIVAPVSLRTQTEEIIDGL